MSQFESTTQQTTAVERKSEGVAKLVRMLRDGTLAVADFFAALSFEGLVFTVNVGTLTSPVTFNAGGLVATEFDLHVAVPAGVVIIPLELQIGFEAYGSTLLLECCMLSGGGSVIGTTSTAVTPVSSNVNLGKVTSCTCRQVSDAGTALTTNIKEIWRHNEQKVVTLATVTDIRDTISYVKRWCAKDSGVYDIVGPSQQLAIYASAQAGTGFICLKYAELPSSFVV